MSNNDKPQLFPGATHARVERSGSITRIVEYVKATRWTKDGDHPDVVRYPIERREFKGQLRVSGKEKYALRFGDWVVEDAKGRKYVVDGRKQTRTEMRHLGGDNFKRVEHEEPSVFERDYVQVEQAGSLASAVVAIALSAIVALLAPEGQLPIFMAVTHLMYYSALHGQWNGLTNGVFDLDEANDDMQLSAHTNTYSPNQDTHDFFDDVTNEVTGTNYAAGGANIDSQTLNRSTNTVTFDGADVVWTQSGSGFSNARKFVVYKNTGSAATSRLFSVVTADGDVGNVTGDLTIQWHTSGIATWSTT